LPTSSGKDLALSLQKLAKLKLKSLYPGHGPSAENGAREHILTAIEIAG